MYSNESVHEKNGALVRICNKLMCGSGKFCQRGSNYENVLLFLLFVFS